MAQELTLLRDPDNTCQDYSGVKQFLVSAALQELKVIRHFVERLGMHPDVTFDGKPTAICYAALKQDSCLMRYLHIHGADVNKADQMGMTPIHYAALGGSCFCISYLVHSGARVNQENHSGKTALSLCIDKPHLAECQEILLRYGACLQQGDLKASCFH